MKWTHKRSSGAYEFGKSATVEQVSDGEWLYRVYYPDWDTPRISAHAVSDYPKTLHAAKQIVERLLSAFDAIGTQP